ncbi:MAG: ECF transporter S component [Anaerolineales bacterium]|jgi:energy-coupling factor transport system substrate-specific component
MATATATGKVTTIPRSYIYAIIPAAVALNVVGGYINTVLRLPTFLDTIGTAVVAMTVGPWWGALAGATTNIIKGFTVGPISIPFAASNVAAALIWGYGVRWGMGKSFVRFLIMSLVVAVVVASVNVPIAVFIFGGATGHFSDVIAAAFLGMGQRLFVSVFSAKILVELADKIISSFVALAILGALPPSLTKKVTIVGQARMQLVVWIAAGIVLSALLIFIFLYAFS